MDVAKKIVFNPFLRSRSLSATVSPDLEKSEEKNEDNVILIKEKKKAGEEEEEEVVVVDEKMGEEKELPSFDHVLTWAASASPSNRLKLMKNMAELQAKIFDIHMK